VSHNSLTGREAADSRVQEDDVSDDDLVAVADV